MKRVLLLLLLASSASAINIRYPATGNLADLQKAAYGGTDSGGQVFSGVIGDGGVLVVPRGTWLITGANDKKTLLGNALSNSSDDTASMLSAGGVITGHYTILGDGPDTTIIKVGDGALHWTSSGEGIGIWISNDGLAHSARNRVIGIGFQSAYTAAAKVSNTAIQLATKNTQINTFNTRVEIGFCTFKMFLTSIQAVAQFGVVHDCVFTDTHDVLHNGSEGGSTATAIQSLRPIGYDTDQFMYVEDCSWSGSDMATKMANPATALCDNAAQTQPYVVRYFTADLYGDTRLGAACFDVHGDQNGGAGSIGNIGNIAVNLNHITLNVHPPSASCNSFLDLRGGDAWVHDNTVTNTVGNAGATVRVREEFYEPNVGKGGATGGWTVVGNPFNKATLHVHNNSLNGTNLTGSALYKLGIGGELNCVISGCSNPTDTDYSITSALSPGIVTSAPSGVTEYQHPHAVAKEAFAPIITSPNNASFHVGTAASFEMRNFSRTSTGVYGTASFVVVSGLPPGMSLSSTTLANGYAHATLSGTPTTAGTYPFTITAHSASVSPDATQSFTATVSDGGTGNVPPTCSLVASPTSGTAPLAVNLTATAADTDGTINFVDFFEGTNNIGRDNVAPYTLLWNANTAGTFSLTAVAQDNVGARTTSSPVTVTVSPGATPAPPANVIVGP